MIGVASALIIPSIQILQEKSAIDEIIIRFNDFVLAEKQILMENFSSNVKEIDEEYIKTYIDVFDVLQTNDDFSKHYLVNKEILESIKPNAIPFFVNKIVFTKHHSWQLTYADGYKKYRTMYKHLDVDHV